jgi:microcystin degradation protein MlrC
MRIAVGGFQHETNTFAPVSATYDDFLAADAWPGLVKGADLLDAVPGINLPAAGFIQEATAAHHTIVPLTWCAATPSARVTKDAYERIAAHLIEDLGTAGSIDAVYLDLHGAMAAEHIDDADGELLRRIRMLVGSSIPIIATLDFHANVSAQMVEHASLLVSYRTYPHTDMAASGARALKMLVDAAGWPLVSHLQQLPFLIPLPSQCTLLPPLSDVMQEVECLERASVVALNFTPGFPASDVPECGPAVFAYGTDASAVANTTCRIRDIVMEREPEFRLEIFSIEAALAELTRTTNIRGRPIIFADTQDNPGGGGTSDTTTLLKAIAASPAQKVLAGLMFDPVAAEYAHQAGTGAFIDVDLGAHSGTPGETPLAARFEVIALGDGQFTASGPFYAGARMNLGRMALLRTGELYIAVSSRKQQAADQAMFHHLNADPRDFSLLILKSSVHFRAAFASIAQRIVLVEAPGANIADPAKLPFKKLRQGMRLGSSQLQTPP